MFALNGQTAFVTGATGHLGRAIAFGLAEAGAHVLVNSRDRQRADETARALRDAGWSAEPMAFDVANKGAVDTAMRELQGRPIHALVNNAYAGGAGTIETAEERQYRESYEISLVAAHNLLRAALPCLRAAVSQTGRASVINIASMYGLVSPDARIYGSAAEVNPPFYGASKAALLQWTRYAACELGPQGIRVNSVSPGPFPAESVQQTRPEFIEKLKAKVPLGRIGHPAEAAGPVVFLASAASGFVNGANLVVDGGWTAW